MRPRLPCGKLGGDRGLLRCGRRAVYAAAKRHKKTSEGLRTTAETCQSSNSKSLQVQTGSIGPHPSLMERARMKKLKR